MQKNTNLTVEQLEVIHGSLLGDGCLRRSGLWSVNFTKGQSRQDNDGVDKSSYLDWHFVILKPISNKVYSGKSILKGKTFYNYTFVTHTDETWFQLDQKWYVYDYPNRTRTKVVPADLILTPLTVCVWFMDDGSLDAKNRNAVFCINGFTDEECEFLVDRLDKDVGIKSHVIHKRNQPLIYVGTGEHKKLIDLIRPHVKWDCFKYKLDDSYDKKHQCGEEHSQSVLTENQVLRMFKLKEAGVPYKDIATEYGVSPPAVSLILSGHRWKHLCKDAKPSRRMVRLNEEQKSEALSMVCAGQSQREVAEKFGANQATISRLIKSTSSCLNMT